MAKEQTYDTPELPMRPKNVFKTTRCRTSSGARKPLYVGRATYTHILPQNAYLNEGGHILW